MFNQIKSNVFTDTQEVGTSFRSMLKFTVLAIGLGASVPATAALIGPYHHDGEVPPHDTVLDTDRGIWGAGLEWLKDADYAKTTAYFAADANGRMTWAEANTWAENLVYGGHNDWHLPDVIPPSTLCTGAANQCTQSDYGHLFYDELGGAAFSSIDTTHNANYGLFFNIQTDRTYWTRDATPDAIAGPGYRFAFNFLNGDQGAAPDGSLATSPEYYAWAVRDVPEPTTFLLLSTAIAGLSWFRRRSI